MKKTLLFLPITVIVLLTSCSTAKKTSTSKTTEIYGAGVIQKPVLVDLDVKEIKVIGAATFAEGSALENVKQEAVADALKKANADVLVEPIFTIETSGGRITATVTGFPATYKNFRSIKAEDVALLNVGITQKARVYEPTAVTKSKSKIGAIILATLGLAAAAVLATVIAR